MRNRSETHAHITCVQNRDTTVTVLGGPSGLCLMSVDRMFDQWVFVTLRGAELDILEAEIARVRAEYNLTSPTVESPQPACVVTNVSDLTPAMRTGILNANLRDCPHLTLDALVRRGFVAGRPGHYRLTEAGQRARATLESQQGARS
jgi:hypothetical protein